MTPIEKAAYDIGAKGSEPREDERLAFEAWMRGHCWKVVGDWDGKQYFHAHESTGFVHGGAMGTRGLWAAWRDRGAVARVLAEQAQAVEPATGRRAELIAELRAMPNNWSSGSDDVTVLCAADMLEADAQDAFTVGLACQPKQQGLALHLLERLSKTLTNLGYSTPEGGMEHFGSQIESQLYNLCRGVDALLAQQVAVPLPLTDDEIMQLGRLAADQEIDISKPTWEQFSLHLARAIEAHHGIGAKP